MKSFYSRGIEHIIVTHFFFLSLIIFSAQTWATTYYVDDNTCPRTGNGTENIPYCTIQNAAAVVNPGDTVIVNDGIYTGGKSIVTLNRSGSLDSWITFRSKNKGKAIINGKNNYSSYGFLILDNISYLKIEGFDLNSIANVGIFLSWGTHDIIISENHLHHIGNVNTDSPYGMGAIFQRPTSRNLVIERNKFNNIGRPHTNDNDWHDQVLYLEGDNVQILNNFFYNNTSGYAITSTQRPENPVINNWKIINNTFAILDKNRSEFHYTYGFINLEWKNDNFVISNNLFHNAPKGSAAINTYPTPSGKTNIIVRNNLINENVVMKTVNEEFANHFIISSNIEGEAPAVLDEKKFNFKPQNKDSPLVNNGYDKFYPLVDFDGNQRNDLPDIGAYELQSLKLNSPGLIKIEYAK